MQLPDLFAGLRRVAGRGEGVYLPPSLGGAGRPRHGQGIQPTERGRPQEYPGNPPRDEARPPRLLATQIAPAVAPLCRFLIVVYLADSFPRSCLDTTTSSRTAVDGPRRWSSPSRERHQRPRASSRKVWRNGRSQREQK